MLFLAPLFSDLPKAVLGAVIIDAVVFGMIDVAELRRLRRVARFDFWIAVAAILGVLSSGVLAGVVIGVALSLVWLIRVAATPPIALLGRERGTQVFRDLDEHPADETFPGVVVLRLDSGLFFATAQALEDRVRTFAEDGSQPLEAVVLDLEGVNFIDSQGAEQLTDDPRARGESRRDAAPRAREAAGARRARRGRFHRAPRCRPHPRQRPSRSRGAAAPMSQVTTPLPSVARAPLGEFRS